ncbi:uncharacterized protein N7459_002423 [Penicillium hispanicum]|uniref:uncharacterized protein n=1 Tax=Penicillium hispanicum TaxID=1080232 RepID=UPI0025423D75|nr:uncharacterized protein N7459_002423 [Penicillium hispanicum]KAJ5592054.1 hypothetical protein N7459_002423 [Penicillium hispanicum]
MSPNPPRPSITVTLGLTPAKFSVGAQPLPEFTVTALSHFPGPITIFTYTTIFHLKLSLRRSDFSCIDITTDDATPVPEMDDSRGGRHSAFTRESGGRDDRYFLTLEPGIPVKFQEAFYRAIRRPDEPDLFESGHKYRMAIKDGETIRWWRWGRKEEVMAPPGKRVSLGPAKEEPIPLQADPLEFEVIERYVAWSIAIHATLGI